MSSDRTTEIVLTRATNGRFLPGHSLPGPGRPKREAEQATLAAIQQAFPPERVVALLEKALTIAEDTNSARGIVAVAVEVLDRLYGKPASRVEEAQDNPIDAILRKMRASRAGYNAEGNPLSQE